MGHNFQDEEWAIVYAKLISHNVLQASVNWYQVATVPNKQPQFLQHRLNARLVNARLLLQLYWKLIVHNERDTYNTLLTALYSVLFTLNVHKQLNFVYCYIVIHTDGNTNGTVTLLALLYFALFQVNITTLNKLYFTLLYSK